MTEHKERFDKIVMEKSSLTNICSDREKLFDSTILPHQVYRSRNSRSDEDIINYTKDVLGISKLDLNNDDHKAILNHFKIIEFGSRMNEERQRVSARINGMNRVHIDKAEKPINTIFIIFSIGGDYFVYIDRYFGSLSPSLHNLIDSMASLHYMNKIKTCYIREKESFHDIINDLLNKYKTDPEEQCKDLIIECSNVFNVISNIVKKPEKKYAKVNTPIGKNSSELKEKLTELKRTLKAKRTGRPKAIKAEPSHTARLGRMQEARVRTINTSMAARAAA
jgi:hypothetical protein